MAEKPSTAHRQTRLTPIGAWQMRASILMVGCRSTKPLIAPANIIIDDDRQHEAADHYPISDTMPTTAMTESTRK